MADLAPLWSLCSLNDDVLRESTPRDFMFDYVDISNVSEGAVAVDLEQHSFGTAPSRARRLAAPGDLIVSTVRTYLRAIAQVEESESRRVYSTGFAVLRPRMGVADTRYLAYTLTSDQVMDEIIATSVGVSYPAIQGSALYRLRVPSHDLDEQSTIADYLDRETREIDAMVVRLDGLSETLSSRRSALLETHLADLFDGKTAPLWSILRPVKDQNHPSEEVLSVYRDYGVIPKASRDDNHNRTPADLTSYQLVTPGDLVINKMKAWQGALGVSAHRGIVSPDYQVARPYVDIVPEYLHNVLRSPAMIPQYRVRSIGVRPAQWRLYWNDFANLRIPVPSLKAQNEIVAELGEATRQIDAMLTKVEELKALLIERRAALITDVVTGRKEVS